MTTEREKQLLFKSYAEDASQVSSQFRPDSASSSGRSSDASGARTPLRPSTARSASNTPRTLASAASLSYRPSSALHGGPGRTARAYAPSALGSPPQSIPATSPLLTSEANIFYGTPAEQIEAIYANEKEITARRFEKTESAKTNAPPFIPDVGLTLHTGREKSERPVASPGKKLVKDIITGESKEVDVTFDSAGMEIRDDDDPSDAEDENERKYADPSADALRPTSPPAVVLVRGEGGFHHFRADSKPIRVVDEDTFRDLELFKTRRLRTEQLEAERKQEEMETNVGARPAWKSYDDYSVRNLLGGKLPAALQPPGYDADLSTSTQLAQERQANVHYPPSFVPAHMLPPSALTGVDTGDAPESVSSLTRHTMQTSTIGDYSAVRPLTALPRGAKKTRARIRAESAHEERRRVLSMNAFSIATMHRIPVPSVSAPADADFSEATPEELKRAADEQRRRIKGTHYATAAWKAKINDNTSSQTGAAVARPNSAVGSEYAQRRLRPFSAYRASEADESLASTPRHGFNSRSVGSASARTPLPSSSQSVQMRAELAAKKAFHLATNRAIARQGFIDIESYNEAARQAHARAVELGLTTSVDPSTFGIQVGAAPASPSGRRPGSAPQRRTKKAYFGPGDVRKVHGEVREKREMEAAEAEAAAAEEYARAMEEAAAQSQAAAAVAESVAASSSDAALVSPATGQFLPIAEEKTDETMDEAAAHVFHHPRSTHSSRLRFLASPRAANYIGTSQHLPLRAFVAPTSSVRIANTHGARDRLAEGATQQETAAAIQSDEAAPGWASVASNTVGMGQLERWDSKQRRLHGSPERPERFVLVTEPGPSDFATLDALRDESTPRVHHASFPLRTRILSASGDVVSDFLYTASRPTPSPSRQGSLLKGRAGAAVVATTAQPTSEVRALAQVPMTARHSFSPPARGNRRRPLAATARPASGSTTRAIDAQERDRAEYLARFQPPTEVVSEQGQPVRTLRVIHFNELPSTRNRVFSRLAHHPDEARVLSNMWTPSSLITAASTF
jgi:hypothetical protein